MLFTICLIDSFFLCFYAYLEFGYHWFYIHEVCVCVFVFHYVTDVVLWAF